MTTEQHPCPNCGRHVEIELGDWSQLDKARNTEMAKKLRQIAINYAAKALCDQCEAERPPSGLVPLEDLFTRRLAASGLPAMYQHFTWQDVERSNDRGLVADAIKAWGVHGGRFFLSGKPGRGKTLLAALGAMEALHRRQVSWTNAAVLFTRAAAEYGSDWKKEAEQLLLGRGALVLDDLGAEAPTDHNSNLLKAAIDGRAQFGDPILITSNLTAPQLGARHGDWLASRLVAGQQYELPGPDFRLTLNTEV